MNGMLQHSAYLEVAAQRRREAEARAHEARLQASATKAHQDEISSTAVRHVRRRPALFRRKARPAVIASHVAG